MKNIKDYIVSDDLIFTPDDVDLSRSPLYPGLHGETFVLGAFNPGMCRLKNGNLLLMVRIAEALKNPVSGKNIHSIRWDNKEGFVKDAWPAELTDCDDPRKFRIREYNFPVFALTSLSWLLPVELNDDASSIVNIHYDKAIAPQFTSQEFGIEDPRISFIEGRYYMTVCCVSSERHSTMMYESDDGINYTVVGIVLDHQNKDMLLFEGKVNSKYFALTRPMGECYFATKPGSDYHPGAYIHMATSPDLKHWKPNDDPFIRSRRGSLSNVKIGGGTPPVLTPDGWLMLYHGVENAGDVGIYRTFWALLKADEPGSVLHLSDEPPLLEANVELTKKIKDQIYLNDVVFTTGITENSNEYILASGELDLACRITKIKKEFFQIT